MIRPTPWLDTAVDGAPVSTATMLSDLSANIFAALLIVLILLLQLKVAADEQSAPPVANDILWRTHVALSTGSVLSMLRERGSGFPGSTFDLVDAGIRASSGTMLAASAAGPILASAPAPVRLYVFSNRWFAPATAALAAGEHPWRDLSIPRALRARDDGQAWSPEFIALLAEGRDEASFRSGLARLLAATRVPLTRDGHIPAGFGRPAARRFAAPTGASGGSTLAALLSAFLGCSALASGAVMVLWTEHRALRRIAEFERVAEGSHAHV